MTVEVQSGASRQEYQKKEIHKMKQTTNSAAKKRQSADAEERRVMFKQ